MTVPRRPDLDELKRLAGEHGFAIRPDEEAQYAILADAILGILDGLEAQEAADPGPVEATRDPGRPADREEDPLNAIVRWCSVSADVEGPLSGRRVAMKDSIAIAGVPMTCGSRVLRDFVPTVDAVVTDRLLRAGAALVAITNMDDLAFSGGGDSSFYGPTLNPFDPTRTAAGSSGGSAAALHYADRVDMSLGCDQGGSIRAPAAWCGVLGLKPTHGLVPYTGIAGIDQTYDHCGPMARTVADTAALLQVIAGADPSDPRQHDVPERDYVGAVERAPDDLSGVRVGVVEEAGAEPDVAKAFEGAVERLSALGASIERISLPEHTQAGGLAFASFVEGMFDLMTSGGNGYAWKGRYWPELADALGPGLRDYADDLSAQVKLTLVLGTLLRRERFGALYAKAQNLRPWLTASYDRALAGVDVLAMPTTPGLPHEVAPDLPLADRVLRGWAMLSNTTPTDMTGHPALTIPAAAASGLPVGVMLVGPRWADDRLLALAATYERRHGWTPARSG
ncbi:MAG TPA: amidase family protein [Gaiellaceae bacterium]